MHTIAAPTLKTLVSEIFEVLGTPADMADVVSGSLVNANLSGHDSHGIQLVRQYASDIRSGWLLPAARPVIDPQTSFMATLTVDGVKGWGPPAANLAVEGAIERANQFGIGSAVIRRGGHIGRVGQYVERIASQNLIGIVTCNTGSAVIPFGGKKAMLGTNPIAIAAPRKDGKPPVFFDGSTSVIAGNKLSVFADKGIQTPPGWLVDKNGEPSTNPRDFFDGGALLPLGGYKGYALSVMVDLLAGMLSGTSASYLPNFAAANGTLVIAIKPEAFLPLDEYLAQVEIACDALKSAPRKDPAQEILLPGEPEQISRRERTATGIPIPGPAWEALADLAKSLGVAVP